MNNLVKKQLTVYHNPRCSKSRQAIEIIKNTDKGGDQSPTIIQYLKEGLSHQELSGILEKLGLKAHDILRSKEDAYKEHNLSPESSDADILNAIVHSPILLERPIIIHGDKAVIGRPPENVEKIL